jgi:hypothetical protein
MEFSTEEHCHIAEALNLLQAGRWSAFEDRLWLAFGDRWEHVRTMLVQHQHVSLKGRWKDEPTLTERGQVLLQRLRARPQTAVG